MQEPIISVILPNYNHGRFLRSRLSSLLNALPDNSELIVVDDCSLDNSVEIIEGYASKHSRLQFIKNTENLGPNISFAKGLEFANGKYIAYLAADDYVKPNFFRSLVAVANKYPGYGVYCSDNGYFRQEDLLEPEKLEFNSLQNDVSSVQIFSQQTLVKVFAKKTFWIPCHASLIDRESLIAEGVIHPSLKANADWFLIHSIALLHGAVYLPEALSFIRIYDDSFSGRQLKNTAVVQSIEGELFFILHKAENKKLRSLFIRSNLLQWAIRKRKWFYLKQCSNWGFLFSYAFNSYRKKLSQLLLKMLFVLFVSYFSW